MYVYIVMYVKVQWCSQRQALSENRSIYSNRTVRYWSSFHSMKHTPMYICDVCVHVYTLILYTYSILAALDDTPNKETVTVLQQCMMDVWRVTSSITTINLDQQQKLLEALDSLSTKAIAVSPTGICIHIMPVIS